MCFRWASSPKTNPSADRGRLHPALVWSHLPSRGTVHGLRRFHSKAENHRGSRNEIQAVTKPSEAAKPAGTPNSLIVTGPAALARALRASRSAHASR